MRKRVDDPAFALREAAEIAGVREARLRDWYRAGLNQWIGMKSSYYLRFSAREIAILAVAADLIRLGVPVGDAGRIATALLFEPPDQDAVVVASLAELAKKRPPGHLCRPFGREPEPTAARVALPIGASWERTMAACSALYETAAA